MNSRVETDRIDGQVEMARATILLGVCGLVFGFGNTITIGLLREPGPDTAVKIFLAIVWTGAIGAQVALHAMWCVLAPVAGRVRLAVGVGLAVFWYGTLVLGIAVAEGVEDEFWEAAFTGLLCLPLICLGVQLPLWILRFWLRWRIVREDADSVGARMTTLRLRHILIGTAWVAVALGAARMATPEGMDSEAGFLIVTFISAIVFMLLTTVTSLPLLIAILHSRTLRVTLPVIFGVLIVTVTMCFLSVTLFSRDPTVAMAFAGAVGSLIGGYLAGLVGVLLVVRNLGYRLRWGRRKKAEVGESPFKLESDSREEPADAGGDATPDDIVFEP